MSCLYHCWGFLVLKRAFMIRSRVISASLQLARATELITFNQVIRKIVLPSIKYSTARCPTSPTDGVVVYARWKGKLHLREGIGTSNAYRSTAVAGITNNNCRPVAQHCLWANHWVKQDISIGPTLGSNDAQLLEYLFAEAWFKKLYYHIASLRVQLPTTNHQITIFLRGYLHPAYRNPLLSRYALRYLIQAVWWNELRHVTELTKAVWNTKQVASQ